MRFTILLAIGAAGIAAMALFALRGPSTSHGRGGALSAKGSSASASSAGELQEPALEPTRDEVPTASDRRTGGAEEAPLADPEDARVLAEEADLATAAPGLEEKYGLASLQELKAIHGDLSNEVAVLSVQEAERYVGRGLADFIPNDQDGVATFGAAPQDDDSYMCALTAEGGIFRVALTREASPEFFEKVDEMKWLAAKVQAKEAEAILAEEPR